MTVTEKHCPCNGTGAIAHGDSLEVCGCPAPVRPDEAHDLLDEWLRTNLTDIPAVNNLKARTIALLWRRDR